MDNLISRKAAIDAIRASTLKYTGFMEMEMYTDDDAVETIEDLPSAEPEIVRCKDCNYIRKWRSEESAKKFGQIYECARNVFDCPKPEDFCSNAERRTDEPD